MSVRLLTDCSEDSDLQCSGLPTWPLPPAPPANGALDLSGHFVWICSFLGG